MKKSVIITIALLHLGAICIQGQTILEKINAIKSQSDIYLWDEYTHPDADTAVVNATKWLLKQVNDGKDGPETLTGLLKYTKNIKMNRGALTRAFVYVKKSELPILYGVRQNTNKTIDNPDDKKVIIDTPEPKAFVPDIFIQKLQQQRTFTNVYKFLQDEKKQGRILQFGALKDVEDYDSFDLILFDLSSQELITFLSPVLQNGQRINQASGVTDSLDNYPEDMVAVIWYIK